MVADALNEQGFLFSQRVREVIQYGNQGILQTDWAYVEKEYPVTAADGFQTRIDIVLRNLKERGFYLCLECKRAHPAYKKWVFFDKDYGTGGDQPGTLFLESFRVHQRPISPSDWPTHKIESRPAPGRCPVFGFYLEVAVKRDGRSGYTETIEDAFLQVMRGHTGMMSKILTFDSDFRFYSVPIVVTTAQLFEVKLNSTKITLASGTIEPSDLKLEPLEYCAVTYHPNDQLSLKSPYLSGPPGSIQEDILNRQTRTIFVVQADAIIQFLGWLNGRVFGI